MSRKQGEPQCRLVFLDGNASDVEQALQILIQGKIRADVQRATDRKTFQEALLSFEPNLVFIDGSVGDLEMRLAVQMARANNARLPILVLSHEADPHAAIDAIRAGADTFVVKGNPKRLIAEVKRFCNLAGGATDDPISHPDSTTYAAHFDALAAHTNLCFWITDRETRTVLYVSPAFERIFGQPMATLTADPDSWQTPIHPQDRPDVVRALAKRSENRTYDHIFRIVRDDESVRWLRDRAHDLCKPGERPLVLRVIEDISRVRTLEEELLSAKKMDAIGRLSGGIAHDFNNILQTIFGFVELTERALEPPHLVEPYLREIREAAERAESLTRQLLLFSHRRVARKSTFPLEQVLLNIDSILRRELGPEIDVDLELTPDIKGIYVDDGQLEQVILNLASNSRHAMPYGGLFRMKTREIEVDSELLTRDGYPVPLGAYIELTVSDDGRGMDADTLAKAFDPFFTTRRSGGGTGIGLATVNELVRQNNGFVWLHSQINEGATLRLIFPACDHDSPKPKPKVAQRTVAEGHVGKVVLLVEHEPAILDLVKSLLTEQGYVVIRASSGDAALRAVLTHTGTIDLLLTDVIMPGLHGPEIHQRLRQDRPRLPAVFMSGYSSEYAAQEWNVDPASVFLQKPFSPDRLLEAVDTALD